MGQTLSFSYYLRQGRAVLLRCFGDTPCPVLPETLGGAPLAALAGYCFSDKEPSLPAGTEVLRWGEDFSHPLCGNFVQSISLPQSLESVGSSAFYNCRRLEKLEFSASLTQVGSDAFMSCDELARLRRDGLRLRPGLRRGPELRGPELPLRRAADDLLLPDDPQAHPCARGAGGMLLQAELPGGASTIM